MNLDILMKGQTSDQGPLRAQESFTANFATMANHIRFVNGVTVKELYKM